MKILTVGSDRKLFEEGSAVLARQMKNAESLERLDIIVYSLKDLNLKAKSYPDVSIEDPRLGKPSRDNLKANLSIYPTNSLSRFLYSVDAVRIAKNLDKPDLVSAQDPFESGVAAYLIARYFNVPLHLQLHTDFLSPYFYQESVLNKIRYYIAKFLIRRADNLRVVTERTKRSVVEAGLQSADKIQVQPIFVDTEKIKNSPIKVNLHQKYPQFEFIILMASRITKEKNIGLAIEAMKEVITKHPKTGLIIVGDGPEKEGLELKAKTYNLTPNIVFENWSDDLPSYYKTANLFLLTSNYEGYGMTVIEALSAGTPVVMSDVGCAGEVLIHGKNGLVFPVGDLAGLTALLERVISTH
ncbi:MAG: glycosyltransferase [bacterium]|nr:glycosyltransferase [bacterium]